jgi:Right handed beta helix region
MSNNILRRNHCRPHHQPERRCHNVERIVIKDCCDDRHHHHHHRKHHKTCSKFKFIETVPYIINESGKYCLTRNLTFDGTDPAITINANNVILNFNNFVLTLTQGNAIGVLVSNVSDVEIFDGEIFQTVLPTALGNAAILLRTVTDVNIFNMLFEGMAIGIENNDTAQAFSEYITVDNCLFLNRNGTALPTDNSVGMLFNTANSLYVTNSTFTGSSGNQTEFVIGIQLGNGTSNAHIINNDFINMDQGIQVFSGDNVIIDKCNFSLSPTSLNFFSMIQFGRPGNTNVIVRNSTLYAKNNTQQIDGIFLAAGTNALIENVIINSDAFQMAAIHIGFAPSGLSFNNVVLKNVLISGANTNGILVDFGKDITIDSVVIIGATTNGINVALPPAALSPATNVTVKNSDIKDGAGNGIQISSNNNVISNNIVNSNAGIGINVTGINNVIEANKVSNNPGGGIIAVVGNDVEPNNIQFNN